jgi:hypothetical protein
VSFKVKFEVDARHDVTIAFDWYEAKQSGLGEQFLRSVAVIEDLLSRDPMRFAVAIEPYRSAKLPKFPYGVHYHIVGNTVSVLACLHFRQNPDRRPGA